MLQAANQPRMSLLDLPFKDDVDGTQRKTIFLAWNPPTASTYKLEVYTTTAETFQSDVMDGIAFSIDASVPADLVFGSAVRPMLLGAVLM